MGKDTSHTMDAVRRSSRLEILERIKHAVHEQVDDWTYKWVCGELGLGEEVEVPRLSVERMNILIERFGPLRPFGDLVTDKIEQYIKWIEQAYVDSRRFPDFDVITVNARYEAGASPGGQKRAMSFIADSYERIGERGVYSTRWKQDLTLEYDDKETPEDVAIGKMHALKEGLEHVLVPTAVFDIDGLSLTIKQKQA